MAQVQSSSLNARTNTSAPADRLAHVAVACAVFFIASIVVLL